MITSEAVSLAPITTIIPIDENFFEVPEYDKTGVYYFVIIFFVMTTVAATVMSGTFLVLSILLWKNFKHIRFFWFLIQLLLSVFFISASNLLIHVPAALGLLTNNNISSEMFVIFTYIIDFFHYSILFSNTVISIKRGVVFFGNSSSFSVKTFEPPFIFFWLLLIWLVTFGIEYILLSWRCRYQLNSHLGKFQMKCEPIHGTLVIHSETPMIVQMIDTAIQIVLPILIFAIYLAIIIKISLTRSSALKEIERNILKQAIFTFVIFQTPSLILIGCNFFRLREVSGFLMKRFVNTLEIFGGIATPSFFFFTSHEIRKLMVARVYVESSERGRRREIRQPV